MTNFYHFIVVFFSIQVEQEANIAPVALFVTGALKLLNTKFKEKTKKKWQINNKK